jgi:hypothetical protein
MLNLFKIGVHSQNILIHFEYVRSDDILIRFAYLRSNDI